MPEPVPQEFAIPDIGALEAEAAPRPAAPAAAPAAPPGTGAGPVAAVLERQRAALMALDGVVMVGEGQDEVGREAIVVGVKRHDQLAGLPRSLDGVRVMGLVIGEVDALSTGSPPPAPPPTPSQRRRQGR